MFFPNKRAILSLERQAERGHDTALQIPEMLSHGRGKKLSFAALEKTTRSIGCKLQNKRFLLDNHNKF